MRILFVFATIIILMTVCFGQGGDGRPRTRGKRIKSLPQRPAARTGGNRESSRLSYFRRTLRKTAEEIKTERPEIPESILGADQQVIINSVPDIQKNFDKEGFSYYDVELAVIAGWRHLRVQHLRPTEHLKNVKFMNFVATLGKVVITSTPDGVEVTIDERQLPRATQTSAFCTPGIHRIRLKKQGYQTLEDHFEIIGNGKLVFH